MTSKLIDQNDNPICQLKQLAEIQQIDILSEKFAKFLDKNDDLAHLRQEFFYPRMKNLPDVDLSIVSAEDDAIYLCGNSLGLQPRGTEKYLKREMDKWAKMGVRGHFLGDLPWNRCDEFTVQGNADLVGAKYDEIAVMNGLSVNAHLLMISFYRPTSKRYKILVEWKSFPSDQFIVESQAKFHGFDPKDAIIILEPREGESCLRTEDILKCIEEEGETISLVWFSGVQYYTGQLFEIERITQAGHKKGCIVGWDMAHAAGNVPLKLHDWKVDFAAWCSYKYLNSSAGGLGIIFIHEKHEKSQLPKFDGWWSDDKEHRMNMTNELHLTPGAAGYRISNPPLFLVCPMLASLDIFAKTSMEKLRNKSLLLTSYLEYLLDHYFGKMSPQREKTNRPFYELVTPRDPEQRGCQLSIKFSVDLNQVCKELLKRGVVCDKRLPKVLRITPVHLYNSFSDVWRFVQALLESLSSSGHFDDKEKTNNNVIVF